ncbi:uncharacterized protein LOC143291662 isoform X2 [Babylonia areolata]|uniref:uncharacterized protein LOC143291662 isoform X2 n=1 Tax=Babylonia areolata TaxID=304850 RepID=UPI003FCEF0DE
MPPKKQQVNGFWLFAQNNKAKWKAQGLTVATNDQLLALASPLWKGMPKEDKKQWDARAKEERQQRKLEGGDYDRMDNTGQVIATRIDSFEEARKRREREIAETTSHWHGKDLTEERFYFINFQEMCEVTEGETVKREWLPREMAIGEYSLRGGIINYYHQLIWPGGIPLGFRLSAENQSSEFHRIPVEELEQDSRDYGAIIENAEKLVRGGMRDGQYPPLYCLTKEYEKTKNLCEWLWVHSGRGMGRSNPLGRIHSVEDMVVQLLAFSGKPEVKNVAKFLVTNNLEGSRWDYISSTACSLHQSLDVSRNCSLSVVRRYMYTVSDSVCAHYDLQLTENHVPAKDKSETLPFRMIPQSRISGLQASSGRGRGGRKPPSSAAGDAGNDRGGRTYSQLARPVMGRGVQDIEDSDSSSVSNLGSGWRQPLKSSPPDSAAKGGGVTWVSDALSGLKESSDPETSQWGGGPEKVTREAEQDDDFPALQMSNMRVSPAAPAWGRGRGRGVAPPPAPGPSAAAFGSSVRPPPGFEANPPLRGRGLNPGPAPTKTVPVGRGSHPVMPNSVCPDMAIGRGVPVGRGATPASVTSAPSVGRGRNPSLGQGTGPGYADWQPSSEVGASSDVGRGYPASFAAAQMPFVDSEEWARPRQQSALYGNGGSANGYDAWAGPSFSAAPVRDTGLDEDTDNFEPAPLSKSDFPSLGGGGSVARPRGVNSGAARGVTVGRGYKPTRGRGYMPEKGRNVQRD